MVSYGFILYKANILFSTCIIDNGYIITIIVLNVLTLLKCL